MKIFTTVEEYVAELREYGINVLEILNTRRDTGFTVIGDEPHYGIVGNTNADTNRISYFNIITMPNRIGFGCMAIYRKDPSEKDRAAIETSQEGFSNMMERFLDDNDDREQWKKS